ncbi:MAG: 30S ribosomal protein S12 methylthiotransferase RimO [Acidimicrobiales bacterium]|jgi:ribosomal protein S12 methylthiotransferase|nr:30S ribosomal protein S12 methylthiotransferase RimO [Acidimicrobiaceae bacterium]MEC7426405.1 30S ribosomal protein S12 methylthiotransferase RimO [Actinomycetota bacterium]MEC9089256.1 30S ribosomal protein S12 methylthiotransferase RimO [Actinomycetota bacterium]|tara:strand:- start:1856 stop:3136 length:1281 start_codon:yes stop_codon:yes gene_type:complete
MTPSAQSFHLHTLGCPKNQVDSDKIAGSLIDEGLTPTDDPSVADLVVVNTCAFIEEAREESINTILALDSERSADSRIVVTGCMAERYGVELAEALPEVDRVAGFGVPVNFRTRPEGLSAIAEVEAPQFDLLNLRRPASDLPWAYVKIAEGCDRACGFCAIPSFRGPQRSRDSESILKEIEDLDVREAVLVAQDLASYGSDMGERGSIVSLVEAATKIVDRVRLLYLYPSDLSNELIEAILASGVPYFDLSLQHVSRGHLRRMRRWGNGEKFLERIERIRKLSPDAAFRSNFIVGYPGETEDDQAELLEWLEEAQLDWCGFFTYSPEEGTYATSLENQIPAELMRERHAELSETQDLITATRRDAIVGQTIEVLVDSEGIGRSHREAPEIDGVVRVPRDLTPGEIYDVLVVQSEGPDIEAVQVEAQ